MFFVNDPQALYGNPGCLKMHFSINLFHANKNFVNYFIHFICIDLIVPIRKGVFIPKLLYNPIASYCLINFDFLLSNTAHFDTEN